MKVYRFLFALGLCLSLAVGSIHTQALYRRNPQASKGMTPEEKEAYTLRRQGESAQREKEVLRRFPNFKTLDAALNNPEGWSYQFITTYAMPDLEWKQYSGPQIQQWAAHLANFLKNIKSDLNKGTLSRDLLQSRANAVKKELQQIAPRLNQAFQDIIFNPLKSKADLAAGKTQAVAEEEEEMVEPKESTKKTGTLPSMTVAPERPKSTPAESREYKEITEEESLMPQRRKAQVVGEVSGAEYLIPQPELKGPDVVASLLIGVPQDEILAAHKKTLGRLIKEFDLITEITKDKSLQETDPLRTLAVMLDFLGANLLFTMKKTEPGKIQKIIHTRNELLRQAAGKENLEQLKRMSLTDQEEMIYKFVLKKLDEYISNPSSEVVVITGAPTLQPIEPQKGKQKKTIGWADQGGGALQQVREIEPEGRQIPVRHPAGYNPSLMKEIVSETWQQLNKKISDVYARIGVNSFPEELETIFRNAREIYRLYEANPGMQIIPEVEALKQAILKSGLQYDAIRHAVEAQYKLVSPTDEIIKYIVNQAYNIAMGIPAVRQLEVSQELQELPGLKPIIRDYLTHLSKKDDLTQSIQNLQSSINMESPVAEGITQDLNVVWSGLTRQPIRNAPKVGLIQEISERLKQKLHDAKIQGY